MQATIEEYAIPNSKDRREKYEDSELYTILFRVCFPLLN